jgi:hypothetical protein
MLLNAYICFKDKMGYILRAVIVLGTRHATKNLYTKLFLFDNPACTLNASIGFTGGYAED